MSSSTSPPSDRSRDLSPDSTLAASQLVRHVSRTSGPPTANVGQSLGEFHLLHELGRGACGRVFLATQRSLSDRPLVLKLTARFEEEHLSLARLQHTYIVPLYLVQDFPAENLLALCMPFVGGAAWSHLLRLIGPADVERSGRRLVELLKIAHESLPLAPPQEGPALEFLARMSYESVVCWIGACLADALQYAHQRGLLHLDIKPSNVLLAGDGQPMLLDFHLAQPMVRAGVRRVARLGGTPGYMAPELERATNDLAADRPLGDSVDGRADVYSLGALLYKSLAGCLPDKDETRSRQILRAVPGVSRGLEDIVHRCLAPEASDRYPDAEQLAADLRRHLTDLPLRGVPNRSLGERLEKWRRRSHRLTWVHVAAMVAVAGGAFAWSSYRRDVREAETALLNAQGALGRQAYPVAIEHARAGLESLGRWPAQGSLRASLDAQLKAAQRARLAETLAGLVDRLRFVQDFRSLPHAKLVELDRGCRIAWNARDAILSAEPSMPTGKTERKLRAELLDLALLWAELQLYLAGPQPAAEVTRELSKLLDDAVQLDHSTPAVAIVRRRIAGQPIVPLKGDSTAGLLTMWDQCAYGRELLMQGNLAEARACFERAIELEPDAFWPYFYATICNYRERRFDEALRAADVAIALAPRQAECFVNRGLVEQATGDSDAALRDFTTALDLNSRLARAAFDRGIVLAARKRHTEAIADFERALAAGADPAATHYQLALVQLDRNDRAAALVQVEQALVAQPDYGPALTLRTRLKAGR